MMKSGEFDVRNCIQNLRSVISKFHSNLIIPSQRHPFISFIHNPKLPYFDQSMKVG